ncbi:MAG: succinylglutamate desuccinylase [Oscillochloris sp.]|nr:succinylglutamate desuccinylase [Oscillochloris sp.]
MDTVYTERFPLLGKLEPGTRLQKEIGLGGAALTDERWPITAICGARPGPAVLVTAGVHGGEYPAIEAAIRLSRMIDPAALAGTLVVIPVVNLPAFRERQMFTCPVDGVNPNRMFPGDPHGSYSEQLVYAVTEEFIAHADLYIDMHGGDIPEALTPFTICRRDGSPASQRSIELATVFGLESLLAIDKPVQQAKGASSYVAAVERGVPGFIVEAGGVGQLQPEAVDLLLDGMKRVLAYFEMIDLPVSNAPSIQQYTAFEWVYCDHAGMFYPNLAVGAYVQPGAVIGRVGSLFGEELETVTSPVAGRVLFLTINPAVKRGGLLMGIGVE